MKFRPSQCGDLVREEEFDTVFNANNGSPKNRRQAKIALALSSGGTGIVSFRLLDDIPVRLIRICWGSWLLKSQTKFGEMQIVLAWI
jgi:hypothetical protein